MVIFQAGGTPGGFLRNSCCELYSVKAEGRAGLCSPGPAAVEKKASSERNCFKRLLKYRLKTTVQQMLNFRNLLSEDIAEGEITSRFRQAFDKFMNASPQTESKKGQLRKYFSNTLAMDAGIKGNGSQKMARFVCFPWVTPPTITEEAEHWARWAIALTQQDILMLS